MEIQNLRQEWLENIKLLLKAFLFRSVTNRRRKLSSLNYKNCKTLAGKICCVVYKYMYIVGHTFYFSELFP
jgi:hypothetical protein